jgi:hypothetical protein
VEAVAAAGVGHVGVAREVGAAEAFAREAASAVAVVAAEKAFAEESARDG